MVDKNLSNRKPLGIGRFTIVNPILWYVKRAYHFGKIFRHYFNSIILGIPQKVTKRKKSTKSRTRLYRNSFFLIPPRTRRIHERSHTTQKRLNTNGLSTKALQHVYHCIMWRHDMILIAMVNKTQWYFNVL